MVSDLINAATGFDLFVIILTLAVFANIIGFWFILRLDRWFVRRAALKTWREAKERRSAGGPRHGV